jgi:hypothetical protein
MFLRNIATRPFDSWSPREQRRNDGHLWRFNGAGKVVEYDHVTDTAQMIEMAEGE